MPPRPLPNSWNLYNLRGSPFFQGTLEQADGSPRPLGLFVGRARELAALRARMHGASETSSRQAVAGAPGVGKTTLVQQLKAQLLNDGFYTSDEHVQVLPDDDTASLFGRILAALYEIVLVNRPGATGDKAMQEAALLVRAAKLGSGGASISALGFGAGVSRGATVSTPSDILIDGPRLLRDLARLARASGSQGLVLHLNNLENLSESQATGAANVLRSLRDMVFMQDGLHTVIVGTTDAVYRAVQAYPQLRSVFDALSLEPLGMPHVHQMLAERYRYLRLNERRAAVPPVADAAIARIYELYRGDLRGFLKALDDGAGQLIGLPRPRSRRGAAVQSSNAPVVEPLILADLQTVLRQRYAGVLNALPEKGRVQQLRAWGESDPAKVHTQAALVQLWKLAQPTVSLALKYLVEQGYVVELPRSERAIQYALSGTSRLIFG